MGYSEYYLSKRFNREMGIRVVDFIKDERINLAKIWLVTTSKSVDEISETLQFNSRNYFGKVFCEKVGMTPSAYRKQRGTGKKKINRGSTDEEAQTRH